MTLPPQPKNSPPCVCRIHLRPPCVGSTALWCPDHKVWLPIDADGLLRDDWTRDAGASSAPTTEAGQ